MITSGPIKVIMVHATKDKKNKTFFYPEELLQDNLIELYLHGWEAVISPLNPVWYHGTYPI